MATEAPSCVVEFEVERPRLFALVYRLLGLRRQPRFRAAARRT
ncbi:hypothetical protein AB0M44_17385 [Streptosporangium subroseum]